MRWKIVFFVSLLINLGLLTALVVEPDSIGKETKVGPSTFGDYSFERLATITNWIDVEAPALRTKPPTVRWSQIAHPDWFEYKSNLVAVGCPPATVREIITAGLDDEFMRRRAEILKPLQSTVWEMAVSPGGLGERVSEFVEEIETMRATKKKTLRALFNEPHPLEAEMRRMVNHRQIASNYGGMPSERVDRILELRAIRDEAMQSARTEAKARIDAGEDKESVALRLQEQIAEIERSHGLQMDSFLTEDEKRAARWKRNSASRWARTAFGFKPTEAEWSAISDVISNTTDEFSERRPDRSTIPNQEELNDAIWRLQVEEDAEVLRRVEELLGEDRFKEFERAKDEDYGRIYKVAKRLSLSVSVANDAYSVISDYRSVRGELEQRDLGLDARNRLAAEMRAELAAELRTQLGKPAYDAYLEHGGEWLLGE